MLTLYSDPSNIAQVEPFLKNLLSKYKVTPDAFGDILVGLTEAVNNAIIHGNRKNKAKKVQVYIKKQQGILRCRISDEGKGFDPQSVPDPLAPENICKCGGRGVFLMKELSDEIKFVDNGSTVEMCFKLA